MSDYPYRKVVVKVGSNVLTQPNGEIDKKIIAQLTEQLSNISNCGVEVILVSSGAVASGRSVTQLDGKLDAISARQVWAAIGQVKLLNIYSDNLKKRNINIAQVLVTKEDFRDRQHYLHMRNCLEAMLQSKILPIVNENDVVSITELMFTDNDELAGLIATMVKADLLVILSNVDGIYTGDPTLATSKILHKIDENKDFSSYITEKKSDFGRGGMITKSNIARKVAKSGICVKIANGKREGILQHLLEDKIYNIGTTFTPVKQASNIKKRIAFAETFAKGEVFVNTGAEKVLFSDKASSLLIVGVYEIRGEFQKGDVVKLINEQNKVIGWGKVDYGSKKAIELIGKKNQKPLIHYDYLYLNEV
jgi:glutamate 5-kinase